MTEPGTEAVYVVTDIEVDGPWPGPNSMRSCGILDGDPATFVIHDLPKDWYGDVPHTHRAIDDARGYANLLVELLRRSRD